MRTTTSLLAALALIAACEPANRTTETPGPDSLRQTPETDAPIRLVERWKAEGFASPKGVAAAPGGGYFISNIAGEPDARDGSGWISKVSAEGEVLEERFATGMDAPQGMVVDRGILYVADIDRIHLVDPDDGTLLTTFDIKGAVALADMAAWNATVLVSDSAGGKIWRLAGDESGIWLEDERLAGVTGLEPDGDRLLVATKASGTLYAVNEAGALSEIVTGLDEAESVGRTEGGYLVSGLPGQVWFVSDKGETAELLNTQENGILQNDLTVFGDTVIIPNMLPGTVTAWTIEAAG